MRVLDLFSGIGGFSLGLERAGFHTVAFCEVDPFCREWLAQRCPGVPCFDDIRSLRADAVGPVELICGGFPCQDISIAGKGAGIEGERSGLWAEMHRLVCELRPDWVLAENVPRLRTLGADRVLGDLEAAGYSCWPLVVGADDIGAPHRRKRVWIVAHRDGVGREGERRVGLLDGERTAPGNADGCIGARVAEPTGERREKPGHGDARSQSAVAPLAWPAGRGQPQHDWEPPRVVSRAQLVLGGDFDGLPVKVGSAHNRARLKAMGNSIVPQIAEAIGRAILRAEQCRPTA